MTGPYHQPHEKTRDRSMGMLLNLLRLMLVLCSFVILMVSGYLMFVYSSIPFVAYWRTIWIETAMTTGDHQWLATEFFPSDVIDRVMIGKEGNKDIIGGGEWLDEITEGSDTDIPDTKPITDPDETDPADSGIVPPETDPPETGPAEPDPPEETDILGQKTLQVGSPDYAGYIVEVNDIEQGIIISNIVGDGFKGKIMLVDDPSRVELVTTIYKGEKGMRILDFLDYYDGIAGINASGFSDPGGNGTGGQVMGLCCSGGEYWGTYANYYGSVILTDTDRLVVGNVSVWDKYNIRDGIQFGPVLIADGVSQVKDSAGYGLQPRTAIGQREDGVIVMLVIDGRDVLHSLGCTVGNLVEILQKYNVVNAACCDGGSSSVIAYDGKVLNKNSSMNPTYGRMMPNAFIVKKR